MSIRPHQFRELGITEGPSIVHKLSAKKWTFHIQGQPYTSLHMKTHQGMYRKAVVKRLEFFYNVL